MPERTTKHQEHASEIAKLNKDLDELGDDFSIAGYFQELNYGIELWKYCLILSLIFLMFEILLIRFYSLNLQHEKTYQKCVFYLTYYLVLTQNHGI